MNNNTTLDFKKRNIMNGRNKITNHQLLSRFNTPMYAQKHLAIGLPSIHINNNVRKIVANNLGLLAIFLINTCSRRCPHTTNQVVYITRPITIINALIISKIYIKSLAWVY